jgi:hypothetical protein
MLAKGWETTTSNAGCPATENTQGDLIAHVPCPHKLNPDTVHLVKSASWRYWLDLACSSLAHDVSNRNIIALAELLPEIIGQRPLSKRGAGARK